MSLRLASWLHGAELQDKTVGLERDPVSSKHFQRPPAFFRAAMGVIFVSGQLSKEMKPGAPVAGGAEPVMATAQPPTEEPQAMPGL